MNQRTDQRAVGGRVADRQRLVRGDDPFDQPVGHRPMRDYPSQRRTALPGRAGGREDDAAHRQIQVGRRGDDRGVVAAQLQQRLAESLRHPRADLLTHPHRTRCAQKRDPRVVDEQLADLAATQDQPAHFARGAHIIGGAFDQRLAGQCGQRCQLGGLPHHGVAAYQRDRAVPGPHRDRKVEGGDHSDHPERMPRLHQPVAGPLGGDGAPVELAGQPHRELADVDHLLHLAAGLGGDLAGLDGDQLAPDRPCVR